MAHGLARRSADLIQAFLQRDCERTSCSLRQCLRLPSRAFGHFDHILICTQSEVGRGRLAGLRWGGCVA